MPKVGILGYGTYIPEFRMKVEEIWNTWVHKKNPEIIKSVFKVNEIAVDSWHDDINTMACDAGKAALEMSGVLPEGCNAIYLGTCTNPYATKASVTVVAEALGLGPELFSCDCQFGAKSGTSAMQICAGLLSGGFINTAIAVGSDSIIRHIAPNDWPLEYTSSAGAAAFVLGLHEIIAELDGMYSFSTETTDFFRLDGDRYIKHAIHPEEEFIGYKSHIYSAVDGFMKKYGTQPSDFNYLVLHQRNYSESLELGYEMGFSREQISPALVADRIGNTGSANALIGLSKVLDQAEQGEKILLASYGYGAGSDILSFTVTENIAKTRKRRVFYTPVDEQINRRIPIKYHEYLRMQRKIIQEYV